MPEVVLPALGTVAAWRREARALAASGVPPQSVVWRVGTGAPDLFADAPAAAAATPTTIRLSREALEGIETALCHSDPGRFARAYALVLAIGRGAVRWGDRSDPAMQRLLAEEKAVRREIHKMHAFVRFREVEAAGPRRAFAAWFEPAHPVEEAAAPFFARRFGDMDWVIATPRVTLRFVDGALSVAEAGGTAPPPADAAESLWRVYYASIFNPARLMVKAMQAEMPKRYWKNLPEAALIPGMIREAAGRVQTMQAARPTDPPARAAAIARQRPAPVEGPADLRAAAQGCRRCGLWQDATQVVFGEGPADAALMLVGEQPGDLEDLHGRPFVGPAGAVLDAAMSAAGLDRARIYVTNAVKHFKFTPRGKRRIHQKPDAGEVAACRWWLDQERAQVNPKLIVAMGATALAALTGRGEGITRRRGRIETTPDGTPILVTIHPSYILRLPDEATRMAERDRFHADLRRARDWLDTR